LVPRCKTKTRGPSGGHHVAKVFKEKSVEKQNESGNYQRTGEESFGASPGGNNVLGTR